MRKLADIIIFFLLIMLLSCEDQGTFVKCSDCVEEEPVEAELTADLDPGHFYGAIVEIWEGNLEDSLLVGSFTAISKTFTHVVTLNKKYTVTAEYFVQDDIYVAVDSATPRVRYTNSQCENPCYYLYDRKCNLKLR